MRKLYAIYDKTAEMFLDPRAEVNNATAIRGFSQGVADVPHKNDLELWHVGDYDVNNGSITPCQNKIYTGFDVQSQE